MPGEPIRVFVHLAHGFGAASWNRRWRKDQIPGFADPLPYGYYQAQEDGCEIIHSEDKEEGLLGMGLRIGVRLLLGFDLVHAWRNRHGILGADVVWTHTESQYLSVLLLFWVLAPVKRPKLIAQSIWLFDHWHGYTRVRKWVYSRLISRADLLTVHSSENLRVAREVFSHVRSEAVSYGIAAWEKIAPRQKPSTGVVRIVSVGNDRHRDWVTLVRAVQEWEKCSLRIASRTIKPHLLRAANIALARVQSRKELVQLYTSADLVVVVLKPNLHASGITVIQEATLCGTPVICTDTGGIRGYFSDTEVMYVPPRDAAALRQAISQLADDPERRLLMVARAQARMGPHDLSSRSFARRHAELSRMLLEV